MTYIVAQSHNGKFGHVQAGTIHADIDPKYTAQLLRMGVIRVATDADLEALKPRTVYRTKPIQPETKKAKK